MFDFLKNEPKKVSEKRLNSNTWMLPIRHIFFTDVFKYHLGSTHDIYDWASSKLCLYLMYETSNSKVSFFRCDMTYNYYPQTQEWKWVSDDDWNLVEFSDEPSGIWYREDWYEDEYSDGKKTQRSVQTRIKITINRNHTFLQGSNSDVVEFTNSLKRLEDKIDMLLLQMPITETKGG